MHFKICHIRDTIEDLSFVVSRSNLSRTFEVISYMVHSHKGADECNIARSITGKVTEVGSLSTSETACNALRRVAWLATLRPMLHRVCAPWKNRGPGANRRITIFIQEKEGIYLCKKYNTILSRETVFVCWCVWQGLCLAELYTCTSFWTSPLLNDDHSIIFWRYCSNCLLKIKLNAKLMNVWCVRMWICDCIIRLYILLNYL